MKKIIITFFAIFLGVSLFAEKVPSKYADFEYVNQNGSLDWETFYSEWDTVPNSYYMYFFIWTSNEEHGIEPHKMLSKNVGWGMFSSLVGPEYSKNDIYYTFQVWSRKDFYYSIVLIFSPWNYQDVKNVGIIPLGQKRYNYNDAIERWNFTINQYK